MGLHSRDRVDLDYLIKNNPRHANCDLVIKRSRNNANYVGLYCVQHGSNLHWLNPMQVYHMESVGIPNPNDCASCHPQEYYRQEQELAQMMERDRLEQQRLARRGEEIFRD